MNYTCKCDKATFFFFIVKEKVSFELAVVKSWVKKWKLHS